MLAPEERLILGELIGNRKVSDGFLNTMYFRV